MTSATSSAMLVAFGVVVLTMLGNTVLEWVKRWLDHRHEATTLRRALLEELKQARDSVALNFRRSGEPIEGGSFLIPVSERNPIYDANIQRLGLLRPNEVSAVVRAYGMLQALVETYAAVGTFQRNDGPVLHAVVDSKWGEVLAENNKGLIEVLTQAVDALDVRSPKPAVTLPLPPASDHSADTPTAPRA